MNEWGSQNYFGNYALSPFYRWGAPISNALLLSSKFTLFSYLVIMGLDSINISLLPDGSVLVSSIEGHCKAIAEGGAFHPSLGCVMPSKGDSHSQRHLEYTMVLILQGLSLPLSSKLSEDQLRSTYISYQVSQPARWLLQTSSTLYPLARLPATSSYKLMRQSIHFQGGLGVGKGLLQALRASILYSPSALEKKHLLAIAISILLRDLIYPFSS